MTYYDDVKAVLALWIDSVARALQMARERIAAPRVVRLVEQDGGAFQVQGPAQKGVKGAAGTSTPRLHIADGKAVGAVPALAAMLKGSRAELILRPKHFLFRPLELPARAGEFLDGIVRAQIDRLTPWPAQDAAFGRTQPVEQAGDRIALTVAATARTSITPFTEAVTALGAQSVSVSTPFDGQDADMTILIVEQAGRGSANLPRLRQIVQLTLVVALMVTAVTLATSAFLGGRLQQEQIAVTARINAARAALLAGHDLPGGEAAAQRALATRKHETPSSVITLDALSRVLPDNTYLTELRIVGDKLQIVGLTRNAPALIPLIEQSSHFAHATFFAPTTQPPNDPREHFHIETRLNPIFTPGT